MNLRTLTADVREQSEQLASLGHTLKFEIADMGCVWIDARKNPPVVTNDDLPADCTITMSRRAVKEVMEENSMSPVLALSLGEIIVEGARDIGERFLALMPEEDEDWDDEED